jgi:uncharacterized protein (DUF2267 family)
MQPSVIDRSVQQTRQWLKILSEEKHLGDENQAYAALRAVLHHLRDRLTVDEAAHLGAQLPTFVRGVYYEAWHPAGTPTKDRREEEFLDAIRDELKAHPEIDPRRALIEVFALLERELDHGELKQVLNMLPGEVRDVLQREAPMQ